MALMSIGPFNATPGIQTFGGTVYITFETRSLTTGALATSGTSTKIKILGPGMEIVVAYTAATNTGSAAGKFNYNFVTANTMSPGPYTVFVETVDGGNTSEDMSKNLFEITGFA